MSFHDPAPEPNKDQRPGQEHLDPDHQEGQDPDHQEGQGGQSRPEKKRTRPLLVVALLLAIILITWGYTTLRGSDNEPETTPSATPSAVAPGPSEGASDDSTISYAETVPPSEDPSLSADGAQQAPGLDDWEPTAEDFAREWANPEGGKDAWLERLEPLTTEEAFGGLEDTSEDAIMDLEFSEVTLNQQDGDRVVADASYGDEGAVLRMGLLPEEQGTGWKVAYVTEAD